MRWKFRLFSMNWECLVYRLCVLAEPLVCISGYIAGFVPAVSRFSILFAGTNIHEVISFFQANAPFSGAGVRFSVSSGMVAKL